MIKRLQVDISQTIAGLGQIRTDQLPFATAKFLTNLAFEIKDANTNEISRVFDRPRPYTLNSVYATPATKQKLMSVVGLKDDASKGTPASRYLAPEVFGGDRRAKRSEMALRYKLLLKPNQFLGVAKDAADAYGNIPAGTMTRILSSLDALAGKLANQVGRNLGLKRRRGQAAAEYFVGRPGGGRLPLGVWQRNGRQLKPILLVIAKPSYPVRFHFFDIAERVAAQRSQAIFLQAWKDAMSTARPL